MDLVQIVNWIYDLCDMISRTLRERLLAVAEVMPAVAVTGPRQSGKTTLCRGTFPDHEYVSLEPLDVREFASQDPRGFLRDRRAGAILDEVQRVPTLFSYLQEELDRDSSPGRFILTGSQHFGLLEAITQSLAGRIALLHLLPLSLEELKRFPKSPDDLWTTLWTGGYPRIHDRELEPNQWLADYLATYVQRDVGQVLRVADLDAFASFLRLAAGRTGLEENLSRLGSDVGVSHPTVRTWLSVLETSFVTFRLPRWHRNLRKRTVKASKMHLMDSGLACHLLGIRSPEQLQVHPLRGAIFESWIAAEILKARVHRGLPVDLFHLRENRGLEVDLIGESEGGIIAVEAKSGATVASDFFTHLRDFAIQMKEEHPTTRVSLRLVYGGSRGESRTDVQVVPWNEIQDSKW